MCHSMRIAYLDHSGQHTVGHIHLSRRNRDFVRHRYLLATSKADAIVPESACEDVVAAAKRQGLLPGRLSNAEALHRMLASAPASHMSKSSRVIE